MNDADRQRQLAHVRDCLTECDRPKTQHEIDVAIERARLDAQNDARAPRQHELKLAA